MVRKIVVFKTRDTIFFNKKDNCMRYNKGLIFALQACECCVWTMRCCKKIAVIWAYKMNVSEVICGNCLKRAWPAGEPQALTGDFNRQ